MEAELLHTFTKVYKFDTMLLLVRLAVLTAVTLTVPIVLFPVSPPASVLMLMDGPQAPLKGQTRRFCCSRGRQKLLLALMTFNYLTACT